MGFVTLVLWLFFLFLSFFVSRFFFVSVPGLGWGRALVVEAPHVLAVLVLAPNELLLISSEPPKPRGRRPRCATDAGDMLPHAPVVQGNESALVHCGRLASEEERKPLRRRP